MATKASRSDTFPVAFRSIVRQVDRLYLYLDGHDAIPEIAQTSSRVVPILSRMVPRLRANGKLLGLSLETEPCLYVTVDDDIKYPGNLVRKLKKALKRFNNHAVVGYHGSILAVPFERYHTNRTIIHFSAALHSHRRVDVLGTAAAMFSSRILQFDVRCWPDTNMVDLGLAIAAARADLPLICLPRRRNYLVPLEGQDRDTIWNAVVSDDTRQTELARELLNLQPSAAIEPPLEPSTFWAKLRYGEWGTRVASLLRTAP